MTSALRSEPLRSQETTALRRPWRGILTSLAEVGPLQVASLNGACALSSPFQLEDLAWHGECGRVASGTGLLRLHPPAWANVQATYLEGEECPVLRIECLDARTRPCLRMDVTPARLHAWDFIAAWSEEDVVLRRAILHPELRPSALSAEACSAFLDDWGALEGPHAFPDLLKRWGVQRQDALRMAEGRFTEPASRTAAVHLLELAHHRRIPISIVVGNPGGVQVQRGRVTGLWTRAQWLQAEGVNHAFSLDRSAIAKAWVVTLPSEEGPVHRLELYGADGDLVAQFADPKAAFGLERAAWRILLRDLGACL